MSIRSLFGRLLDLTGGAPLREEDGGVARRAQLAVAATLIALVISAFWGVAVRSQDWTHALMNVYRVPMVVLLSALFALPAGLLAWKLSGAGGRVSDLLLGFALGIFAGSLVLGAAAPIVAIYYWSRATIAPWTSQAVSFLSLVVGAAVFFRRIFGTPVDAGAGRLRASAAFLFAVQLLVMLQLLPLARPILSNPTPFDHGIDMVVTQGR